MRLHGIGDRVGHGRELVDRELTLSAQHGRSSHMVRAPQPETVKDYELIARTSSGEVPLAKIEGNYQRLRRHRVDPVETTALRLRVTATHGSEHVRVFEIRCYG